MSSRPCVGRRVDEQSGHLCTLAQPSLPGWEAAWGGTEGHPSWSHQQLGVCSPPWADEGQVTPEGLPGETKMGDSPSPGCEWKPTDTVTLVRERT